MLPTPPPQAQTDDAARERGATARAIQAGTLMAVWLLLSGKYDPFHIGAGVFSVGLVFLVNRRLFRVSLFPGDQPRRIRPLRALAYVPWLFKAIVLAAVDVARVVLSPRMPMNPSLLGFHADLANTAAQVVLANSITLTPGTITIEVDHGVFLVHALTDSASQGLVDGSMPARVAGLFSGTETGEVSDISIVRSNRVP